MALILPRLGTINPADAREFSRYWDEVCRRIEEAFASIDTISIEVDDVSATGLFRARSVGATSGADASIALEVRKDLGSTFAAASLILSVIGALSRIEIDADEVLINGVLMSAGGVLTNHLADNAATDTGSVTVSAPSFADTTWRDAASITREWSGQPAQFDFLVSVDNNDGGDHKIVFRIVKDGVALKNFPNVAGRGYVCPRTNEITITIPYDDSPSAGSHTYAYQYACVAGDLTTALTLDGAMRWSDIKR